MTGQTNDKPTARPGRRAVQPIKLDLDSVATTRVDISLTVEQQVVAEIRQLISSGALGPGARLPLRQLAEHFGVSTTPVRAALIQLSRDGLVVHRTHGGMHVAEMSLEEFEEVWTSRVALEWWLTRRSVEQIKDEDLPELDRMFDALREAATQRSEWHDYVARSWVYRRHLFTFAQRPRMLAALDITYARSARYSRLMLDDEIRVDHAFASMIHLHEAVHRRDAMGAQSALRQGMEWTMESALEQFSQAPLGFLQA